MKKVWSDPTAMQAAKELAPLPQEGGLTLPHSFGTNGPWLALAQVNTLEVQVAEFAGQ